MRQTSTTWKNLLASGAALEAVAEIGGTTYTDLPAAPVVSRALMQNGLSVGNAVSASCALSVRTEDSLPRAAEVKLKVRLTDGTTTSEWLPMGTFFISRRSVDPVTGVVALECYDALLKANALWEPAEGDLPMAMADAADALAGLLGVALDGRNDIATGAAYVIESLSEGETIRDTLARIAVANGGNWIITPANRLRLVPLADAADAAAATDDVLDVAGVTGGISVQPASVVTGIRYGGEDGDAILGDDTGTVIDIGGNTAFLQVLYDRLVGLTFRPFDLAGAVYDPAAELGDYVRAGANGEVASVLHSEVASYGPHFTGGLSAPQGGELADEYPYIGGAANKALIAARAYARQVTEALDNALTQQDIFNRLTGNGAAQGLFLTQDGQLYVNASYIYSGTLTLGGLNNQNGTMRVLDASGNVVGTWTKDGIAINSGSLQLTSEASTEKVKVSIKENFSEPFKVSYEGANIDADTNFDGRTIILKDNNSGARLYLSPAEIYISESNTVWLDIAKSSSGIASLRLVSDDGDISLAPDRFYIAYNGDRVLDVLYNNGNPVLYFDGYLSVGDAASTRSSLGITPANIGALPTTGGTVTGAVARKVDADFDTAPVSVEWNQIIPITDDNNDVRGGVYMVRNTDGSYQVIYGARNPSNTTWTYIAPRVDANGNPAYAVSHPTELKAAIGLGNTNNSLVLTGTTGAALYTQLNALPISPDNGAGVTCYISNSALKLLTGKSELSAVFHGMITRASSTRYRAFGMYGDTGYVMYWAFDITSAGVITPLTVYKLQGTAL